MTSDTPTTITVLKERIGSVDAPLFSYSVSHHILRTKTILRLKEDSISIEDAQMTSGLSSNGKRWYKWATIDRKTIVFRARKNGPRRVFGYHFHETRYEAPIRGQRFYRSTLDKTKNSDFWGYVLSYDSVFEEFKSRMLKYFPYVHARLEKFPTSLDKTDYAIASAYPALLDLVSINDSFLGFANYLSQFVGKNLTAFREETLTLAVKKMFKSKARKSLVKAIDYSHGSELRFAYHCRYLVPIDWIVDGLNKENTYSVGYMAPDRLGRAKTSTYYKERDPLTEILSHVSEGRKRVFFLSLWNNEDTFEVCRLFEWANGERKEGFIALVREASDVSVLHQEMIAQDRLNNRQRIRPSMVNKKIELTEITSSYQNLELSSGLKIVAPEDTDTLVTWSNTMGNCISGYAFPAERGDLYLGGVYSGEKLIANFEIDKNKNLKQLLGKYNQHLTQEDRDAIIDALASVEAIHIDTVTQAWGVTDYTPTEQRMIEA